MIERTPLPNKGTARKTYRDNTMQIDPLLHSIILVHAQVLPGVIS
jgi:hypothetical protein